MSIYHDECDAEGWDYDDEFIPHSSIDRLCDNDTLKFTVTLDDNLYCPNHCSSDSTTDSEAD